MLNDLGRLLIEVLLLFFPAYLGNAAPVVLHGLGMFKGLWLPLDGGAMWRGKRVLGDHKTWAGVLSAALGGAFGGVVLWLMGLFGGGYEWMGVMAGWWGNWWIALLIGGGLGLAAISGDVAKSFFKRRLNIAPGRVWLIFDQVDFIVGAWIWSGLLISWQITWPVLIAALLITPLLHLGANLVAYLIGWKKVWW